jgi:p-aminobenzoyl-glutamate transporter AbgT
VNYTIKNDKIYLYPKPDGVYTTSFEYYSTPEVVTSLSQEIKKEFVNILIYFVAAQAAYIRNNEKRGNLMEVKYTRVLENQIEDVT